MRAPKAPRSYYRSRAYRKAVFFIALNDDVGAPDALDAGEVAGYTTVVLCSEVWSIPQEVVAEDVVRCREGSDPYYADFYRGDSQ